MDEAWDKEETIESLTKHILVVNFTNNLLIIQMWVFHVDASSVPHHVGVTQSFVHALFYLPTLSKYFTPVRAEVEVAIKSEGWSKSEGLWCETPKHRYFCAVAKLVGTKKKKISHVKSTLKQHNWDLHCNVHSEDQMWAKIPIFLSNSKISTT